LEEGSGCPCVCRSWQLDGGLEYTAGGVMTAGRKRKLRSL
jgi:hypothetical protein